MSRRRAYTKVFKENQLRADHVRGMGDKTFIGFQCLNPECTSFIFSLEEEVSNDFSIICPDCGYILESGSSTKFYDYILGEIDADTKELKNTIESGDFEILHADYVGEASKFKYCIICNTLKPLDFFDKHKTRKSGRQGECRLCKAQYNSIKNQTRISDQHREAAQKRRLYIDIAGHSQKIDTKVIFARFEGRCFKCGEKLFDESGHPLSGEFHLDHTLPAFYLWPMTTDNATLLCQKHNGEKSGNWPSKFYNDKELRLLSAKTGISYQKLSGDPEINPVALETLSKPENVMALFQKHGKYMDEIIRLRNRILTIAEFDFFASVENQISRDLLELANSQLKGYGKKL